MEKEKVIDYIKDTCLAETSKNPHEIFKKLAAMPFCHIHGPEHHVLVGASLLTAYKNAGGDIDLEESLEEVQKRGENVPGAACGMWGACGASISSGIFVSIITGNSPLSEDEWRITNLMTATALKKIGEVGGPRCCKRNSSLAMLAAVDYIKENFGIEMEMPKITCEYYPQNKQCIKDRCPFWHG